MTRLDVIIVNWNTGQLLARCLAAIARTADQNRVARIVVVDNASRDRSLTLARQQAQNMPSTPVTFIALKQNVGFARANNIAARALHDQNHILLLNPDTEVQSGLFENLLHVLESDNRAGIVGPQLVHPDGGRDPSVRRFPTTLTLLWLFLKLHRLFPGATFWQRYLAADFNYNEQQNVDQVKGAVFLMHRALFNQLNGLDEGFWLWFEEVDACYRARQAGWNVVYTPRAKAVHHGAASFEQLVGIKRTAPFLSSSLHYARKHLGPLATMILYVLYPVAAALAIPASMYHIARRQQARNIV